MDCNLCNLLAVELNGEWWLRSNDNPRPLREDNLRPNKEKKSVSQKQNIHLPAPQETHTMVKKRKISSRPVTEDSVAGWNDRGGKLAAINSYEDVADSEDEFHINRDKIMLDDGPDAKRRRKWQEEGD
jgi:hypothetical protein